MQILLPTLSEGRYAGHHKEGIQVGLQCSAEAFVGPFAVAILEAPAPAMEGQAKLGTSLAPFSSVGSIVELPVVMSCRGLP